MTKDTHMVDVIDDGLQTLGLKRDSVYIIVGDATATTKCGAVVVKFLCDLEI